MPSFYASGWMGEDIHVNAIKKKILLFYLCFLGLYAITTTLIKAFKLRSNQVLIKTTMEISISDDNAGGEQKLRKERKEGRNIKQTGEGDRSQADLLSRRDGCLVL